MCSVSRLLVVFDKYEESSAIEEEDDHEKKAPILSKALAGMGDPDAELTQKPSEEDTKLQAGRYGAPQRLAPLEGQDGSDDNDDMDTDGDEDTFGSMKESASTSGKPSTSVLTLESHPGMYSERDPILKEVTKKPGSIVEAGGYVGPMGRSTPQAGLEVKFALFLESVWKRMIGIILCFIVLSCQSDDQIVETTAKYSRLVVKTLCFFERY